MKIDNQFGITPSSIINTKKTQTKNESFSNIFNNLISEVDRLENVNSNNNKLLATDSTDEMYNVLIDSEKLDIALQFTLQVRNKIMDAYDEIMRMQI